MQRELLKVLAEVNGVDWWTPRRGWSAEDLAEMRELLLLRLDDIKAVMAEIDRELEAAA